MMDESTDTGRRRYSIGDVAEATGVSRRTVRFYVQRDLIDPPLGRGRGQHYDERHVQQILQVRTWQRLGVPLAEMAAGAVAPPPGSPVPAPPAVAARHVVRLELTPTVTVELATAPALITPALAADLAGAVDAVLRRHIPRHEEE